MVESLVVMRAGYWVLSLVYQMAAMMVLSLALSLVEWRASWKVSNLVD